MVPISVNVDTRELDRAFEQYLIWNTREIPKLVNQTAYDVAVAALQQTYAPDKARIRADLLKPSTVNAKAPIASIAVNVQRKKQGKPGLNGQDMVIATESLIKRRESFRNFARSGWLPAMAMLRPHVGKKTGAGGIKIKKGVVGGATSARPDTNWQAMASIWNAIEAKDNESQVKAYLEKGLQMAINLVATDKMEYVFRKKMEEGFAIFNR